MKIQYEPRISFAWQPFSGASGFLKSDFVIRGGFGIFNDIFPGQIADNMSQNPNLDNSFTTLFVAGVPQASNCGNGFLSPAQSVGAGQNLFECSASANADFNTAFATGSGTVAATPNIVFTSHRTHAPQYQKWSLEIQKGLGRNDSIDIGYFGNHGIYEPVLDNSVNACGGGPNCAGGAFGTLPANPAATQFIEITQVLSAGVSNYNGIVASFKHRFSGRGGSGVFQFNYTYGKALDEISNGGFNAFSNRSLGNPQDPFNLRNMYGPADYDARHSLNANYVWELPIRRAFGGHGWAPLVDGWQVSGAVFYRTGFPFSVTDGAEATALGANNFFGPILPNILTPVDRTCSGESHAGANAVSCYDPASFGDGAGGSGSEVGFGAQGLRNAFRGPNYFDTDFSFTKKTKIPHWERGELQLGLQFFNVLNHPNFNLPHGDISAGNFGTITSLVNPPTSILGSFLGGDAAPRLIQIKAQFTF